MNFPFFIEWDFFKLFFLYFIILECVFEYVNQPVSVSDDSQVTARQS